MKTTKIEIKKGRPTFFYKNNDNCEIRAGGIIMYRYKDGMDEPELLMIKNRGKYEDFGGRTEMVDSCIEETICREADEESNGIFPKDYMIKLIKKIKPVYCSKSKYMIYFIKTNKEYNPVEFGDWEIHDGIPRTVEWVKISKLLDKDFVKKNLHIRLKFFYFFQKISSLSKLSLESK